jgi:hypothetical protein
MTLKLGAALMVLALLWFSPAFLSLAAWLWLASVVILLSLVTTTILDRPRIPVRIRRPGRSPQDRHGPRGYR